MSFKLGIVGEGFTFFLPDTYRKPKRILGSGIRRSINGTARRDVVAVKHNFELGFDFVNEKQYLNFLYFFNKNIMDGVTLQFTDDEGISYNVIWGSESFGLDDRKQGSTIYWSGTIFLEEK